MVTKFDYTAPKVEAARRVIIELMHLLKHYYNDLAIIGGWVPDLGISNNKMPYTGSMDVDLAVNHRNITEEGYRNMHELLMNAGYYLGNQPFIYLKKVQLGTDEVTVQVDFLAGESSGTGNSHRHQNVHGIKARKAKGCDIVFDIPAIERTLEGKLPTGGLDSVKVKVASAVPFIVMKGFALDDRLKQKDAWDIYYYLNNYPGGVDRIIEEFKPHLENKLVQEGLQKLKKHFASIDHAGPNSVTNFEGITDSEEQERVKRDAFERVDYLLRKLGI